MKKVMIIIIFILLFFIVGLTVFKYKYENNRNLYRYDEYELSIVRKNSVEDISYQEKNFENIKFLSYNSINFDNKKNMKGYIYINDDKYISVYDQINDTDYIVSEIKFRSIYTKDYDYNNVFEIYAISEDDKLYFGNLKKIDNSYLTIFFDRIDGQYTNFVDLELRSDKYSPKSTVFILSKKGAIYNINTGLFYNPKTISLYDKIHVYDDKTMTNIYGKVIAGKDGVPYKIKYIFNVVEKDEFIKNTSYIVITEDDKFLYFNDDVSMVYELNRRVNNIEFDKYYPYTKGVLTLSFGMNSKMNFTVECNEYYCIN